MTNLLYFQYYKYIIQKYVTSEYFFRMRFERKEKYNVLYSGNQATDVNESIT